MKYARKRYILGLDGLRGLAIIAVLGYHLAPQLFRGGYIGVDIFFVISGFLISTLLIAEHHTNGKINFKNFWHRRARRLLPALFATICVMCSLALLVRGDILVGLERQLIGAATFSSNWLEIAAGTNYFSATNPHLFTNLWSLGVEEQFYLLWPLLLLIFLSVPLFARKFRGGIYISAILAITSAILMALTFKEPNPTRVYYGADTHFFGLMLGAMLAFWSVARHPAHLPLHAFPPFKPRTMRQRFWQRTIGYIAFIILITLIFVMSDHSVFAYKGGLPLASLCTGIIVVATVSSRSMLRKLFTWRPLEWVGIRSYGIYLWHWPILILLRQLLPQTTSGWIIAAITCTATGTIAALSYRYLEVPVQRDGFLAYVRRGIIHEIRIVDGGVTRKPHPVLLVTILLIFLTATSVVIAPSKTKAQQQIEAGQTAIAKAAHEAALTRASSKHDITGSDITVIGDSVTLASAPALTERFPGMYIDARISRSVRNNGLETIQNLDRAHQLRRVVVLALGTNGYYGNGNLDKIMAELHAHDVIFVNAYGPDVWDAGNNDNLRTTKLKYKNMYIADWNTAISAHRNTLGPDGIHPTAAGGRYYADAIAAAIAQIQLRN